MHRIYFDGNDGPDDHSYGLWLAKSIEDLARIPGGPKEGMLITIYMIGEIEMETTLAWNSRWDAWTARPLERTVRLNTDTWDQETFACKPSEPVTRS